jgi:predicted dehydrogenase
MKITRREFLTSTAATVLTVAAPRPRRVSANDKVNVAMIGVGGQGKNDLRSVVRLEHNIVAICDPDWRMAGALFDQFPEARRWRDYRKMLDEQKDIDAVVIATPDHHHAPAAMTALALGTHTYCEKPLTHSVYEARMVGYAASGANVATQMGNSAQAADHVRTVAEVLRSGVIGPVREVHLWTDRPIWPQAIDRPEPTRQPHEGLDWDLWLGPAPARPYDPAYHPFRWRGWWDFGTGALGDMGCHMIQPVFYALELDYPTSVRAESTPFNNETYPASSIVTYEFSARGGWPPCTVTWYDGGNKPPVPYGLPENFELAPTGMYFVGDKGVLFRGDHTDKNWGRLLPEDDFPGYMPPAPTLPRSPGHWEEWFGAIFGGPTPGATLPRSGIITEAVLLGNVALRADGPLEWDPIGFTFPNAPGAAQYLRRDYRDGWTLPT